MMLSARKTSSFYDRGRTLRIMYAPAASARSLVQGPLHVFTKLTNLAVSRRKKDDIIPRSRGPLRFCNMLVAANYLPFLSIPCYARNRVQYKRLAQDIKVLRTSLR